MGLINPFVFKLKVLFQNSCIAKLGWDDELVDELLVERSRILKGLHECCEVDLSRWYGDSVGLLSVELHGFCDASQKGFGCCVYGRFVDVSGKVTVPLITSQ